MVIGNKVKPKLPPIAPGLYPGICVGVIDLGEQYSEMFKKYDNKVQIVWELPTLPPLEIDGKPQPRQLSRTYTFAANKKSNLRKLISSWNGIQYSDEAFNALDLFSQLGKPCALNVVLNDTGEYSNIDSVTPLMQGYPVPTTATPFIKWDMDEWNDAAFEALPEWAQEKIKKSTQYQKAHPPTTTIDFSMLSGAQAAQPAQQLQQYAAPAVQQNAQPVQQQAAPQFTQQAAPQSVQQTAPPPVQQTQQSAYAAPAAPGAVNQQAYQIPYQGAAQQPIVQQGANTGGVPF